MSKRFVIEIDLPFPEQAALAEDAMLFLALRQVTNGLLEKPPVLEGHLRCHSQRVGWYGVIDDSSVLFHVRACSVTGLGAPLPVYAAGHEEALQLALRSTYRPKHIRHGPYRRQYMAALTGLEFDAPPASVAALTCCQAEGVIGTPAGTREWTIEEIRELEGRTAANGNDEDVGDVRRSVGDGGAKPAGDQNDWVDGGPRVFTVGTADDRRSPVRHL